MGTRDRPCELSRGEAVCGKGVEGAPPYLGGDGHGLAVNLGVRCFLGRGADGVAPEKVTAARTLGLAFLFQRLESFGEARHSVKREANE